MEKHFPTWTYVTAAAGVVVAFAALMITRPLKRARKRKLARAQKQKKKKR